MKFCKQLEKFDGLDECVVDLTEGDEVLAALRPRLSQTDIEAIDNTLKSVSAVGAMLYFGESEFQKSDYSKDTNEVLYSPFLLQHVIVGLSVL